MNKNLTKLAGILKGFSVDLIFWIYILASIYFLMNKWFHIEFSLMYIFVFALILDFLFFILGDSIGRKIFLHSKKLQKKWIKSFWSWFVIVGLLLTFVVGWNIVGVKPIKFFTQFKNAKGISSGIFDPSIVGYQITEKSIEKYNENNIPQSIITICEKMKHKKFATKTVFVKSFERLLGKSYFEKSEMILIQNAEQGTGFVIDKNYLEKIRNVSPQIIAATKTLIKSKYSNQYDFTADYEKRIGKLEFGQYKNVILKDTRKNTDLLDRALGALAETIFLALLATIFAISFAFIFSFFAARNLMPKNFIGNSVYILVRTFATIFRSIEAIVWAIIFCVWVGIGPFAGMLALMIHSIASLTKLYSEQIENIDSGPIEAMQATGANTLQVWLYAVIPQIISPYLAFTIYRWDINVRMATIVGFVGGGGIGILLLQNQQLLRWHNVGLLIWLIAFVVWVMDMFSAKVREKLQNM
ncbi:MAG: phosphonate ABC transporter, permease protein PhnE [Candidatus Cloacimonadota bacterium]|nr:phosphonate ABC transporter, permease protein PhnE [Candidatus Cloacimonadota bacterium]